jgi:hypothetical protein
MHAPTCIARIDATIHRAGSAAVDNLLLRELDERPGFDCPRALEGGSSRESPAGATLLLVLNPAGSESGEMNMGLGLAAIGEKTRSSRVHDTLRRPVPDRWSCRGVEATRIVLKPIRKAINGGVDSSKFGHKVAGRKLRRRKVRKLGYAGEARECR